MYALFEEISVRDTIFGSTKGLKKFKIATNQSLNLSPTVSTLGLFLFTVYNPCKALLQQLQLHLQQTLWAVVLQELGYLQDKVWYHIDHK